MDKNRNSCALQVSSDNQILKNYWMENLSGEYSFIGLSKGENKDKSIKLYFDFPTDETDKLNKLAKSQHAVFIMLFSAFSCVLYCITKCKDFVLFIPSLKECDTNTLIPIRVKLDNKKTFKTLIIDNLTTIENGYKYASYPIKELLEANSKADFDNSIVLAFDGIHNNKYCMSNNTFFKIYVGEKNLRCSVALKGFKGINKVVKHIWTSMIQCIILFFNNREIGIDEICEHIAKLEYDYGDSFKICTSSSLSMTSEEILSKKLDELLEKNQKMLDENFYDLLNDEFLENITNSLDLAILISIINKKLGKDFKLEEFMQNICTAN
ncbi:MAG: hypothetical protein ACOZCL_02165 [Bacillota bacterium]